RLDAGGIAKKQKFHIGPPSQGAGGTRNDHLRSMVAAHGVERNSYWLAHGLCNSGPARKGRSGPGNPYGRWDSKNHLISAARRSRAALPASRTGARDRCADWAAAMGKQRKIPFVQAFFSS